MKKLFLAIAFFSFIGLTYASPCDGDKKCDNKECTHTKGEKKECTHKKDSDKKCCADKKAEATKTSCSSSDKKAGKSCCASKAKTETETKEEK